MAKTSGAANMIDEDGTPKRRNEKRRRRRFAPCSRIWNHEKKRFCVMIPEILQFFLRSDVTSLGVIMLSRIGKLKITKKIIIRLLLIEINREYLDEYTFGKS
jgi:hypothetical protein